MRPRFSELKRFGSVLFLALLATATVSAQEYFPPGALDKTPQGDRFKADWYSRHLKALHEPSLWELSLKDPKAEAYRFLWLRTLHHPIAVRLVLRSGGSGWLYSRMTSGKGGHETGRITRYGSSWLRKSLTREFLTAIERADFQKLQTLADRSDNTTTPEGSQWIVEGVRDGQYHIVDRHSPDVTDPVRAIGMLALKLARFRIRPGEIY